MAAGSERSMASVLVAGTTGLVGRVLISLLEADPAVALVHALLRRAAVEVPHHPKLHLHLVDFHALPALPPVDAAFCGLGTTIKIAGSKDAFREVDFDHVVSVAKAAHAAGAKCFAVVSALGANAQSAVFYNRVKGEMEAAVARIGFDCLVILRPSLLIGDRSGLGQPTRPGEWIAQRVLEPLAPVLPTAVRPIPAATVARAMIRAVRHAKPGVRVIESAGLWTLGR
jgi:uncharacterized protein YbjT (DUF2867 family)